MRRIAFCLLLLFALGSAAFALDGRYRVFTAKTGWFGLGPKVAIMLDSKNGNTWMLTDDKWQSIPRIDEVSGGTSDEAGILSQRLQKAIGELQVKQEEDIKALKIKQEESLKSISSQFSLKQKRPARSISYARKRRAAATAAPAVMQEESQPAAEDGSSDSSAPSWFNQKQERL